VREANLLKKLSGFQVGRWSASAIRSASFSRMAVELRGRRRVHRLSSVVFHTVVALLVPVVKKLFFWRTRQPAKFNAKRWHSLLDETVLIAANKAYVVGLFVGLHCHAGALGNRRTSALSEDSPSPCTSRNFSGNNGRYMSMFRSAMILPFTVGWEAKKFRTQQTFFFRGDCQNKIDRFAFTPESCMARATSITDAMPEASSLRRV